MISFYSQEIDFRLESESNISNWIKNIISTYNNKCGDLNIIFCSDDFLLDINKKFLKHDYYTDIITFNLCTKNKISGELYISIDTVNANSVEYNQRFIDELNRVIIHGVLHLIGLDDHTEEDIVKMRKAEDDALQQLVSNDR